MNGDGNASKSVDNTAKRHNAEHLQLGEAVPQVRSHAGCHRQHCVQAALPMDLRNAPGGHPADHVASVHRRAHSVHFRRGHRAGHQHFLLLHTDLYSGKSLGFRGGHHIIDIRSALKELERQIDPWSSEDRGEASPCLLLQ